MNYEECLKVITPEGPVTKEVIIKVLDYINEKKVFTPLQVAKACKVGYAMAVVTIDKLYDLGYTDYPGYIEPGRDTIKLLQKRRSKEEVNRHKKLIGLVELKPNI